ncbi:alcohol dehydrogenase catalytic domain-containing protein [Candidatus Omnitrophota bacterium]
MRVAVYYNNNDVRIEEQPKPQIGSGELLVEMKASGICGTDIMEWYRIKKAPRILGHEISGIIVESQTERFSVGQRVFVSHHVPCNTCKYCLDDNHTACATLHGGNYDPGGYSEFIRVPSINVERGVYVLPDAVSFEEGTWIEPLACAIRGLRVIGAKKEHTILVQGCGVSGLLNILLAKLLGATVVATDIDTYRLQKARACGADHVVHAQENLSVTAERIIVCTGAEAVVPQAFHCIDKKGIILFFAIPQQNIPIPSVDFWRNEITVTSSYGAAPQDLEKALVLITEKKINVQQLITHTFPLEKIQEGFNLVAHPEESLKVILVS